MKEYNDLLRNILENGIDAMDRTGVGTRSIFGAQIRFDLNNGFPAVTTKKLAWKSVVSELLWFLEGSTDERRLAELLYGTDRGDLIGKTTIWTANADAQGKALGYANTDTMKELGPVYGAQWRSWETGKHVSAPLRHNQYGVMQVRETIDQIENVIDGIKRDPYGRRHLVSAWNVGEIDNMALPPCHYSFQFYVRDNKLSLLWNQRSVDSFLGLPFNIASYALLTHIIARECGLGVGELIGNLGDTHIYHNHFEQVKEQIARQPYALPVLLIDDEFDLKFGMDFTFPWSNTNLFHLLDYNHHPALTAPMAV